MNIDSEDKFMLIQNRFLVYGEKAYILYFPCTRALLSKIEKQKKCKICVTENHFANVSVATPLSVPAFTAGSIA